MGLLFKYFLFLFFLSQALNGATISLSKEENLYLNSKENIKICVLPNWLPFEEINEDGKHNGVGADIIKIISQKLDKKFTLIYTNSWFESLQFIRKRECDVLPVAMDIASRRDAMNFTKPYINESFVVATTLDKLFIKDAKDLKDKKVALTKGYAFLELLKQKNPQIKIIEVNSIKEGLEKVSKGEVYGYVDTIPTIGYYIQKYGMVDLKIAGELDYTITLSMASRNDEPLLNEILQKALDDTSKEEIRTIVGKWIEIKVQQELDYSKLFYIVFVFLLVLLVILYKNRSINKINKKLAFANEEIIEQQKMVDKYVMILSTDLDGKITHVNEAYCQKIGFSKKELLGKTHSLIRHPELSDSFFKNLWQVIQENKIWQGEIKNITKNGEDIYFNVIIEPLIKEGKKIGYRSISEDITNKKRIEQLSVTDKLTGLYNRLKIDKILAEQVNIFKRYKTAFSVILLDVDNFKSINDNHGHDVGDKVLKDLAKYLNKKVRKTDYIGRWGGEEFIVICSNTNSKNAFILAEHIRTFIEIQKFETIEHLTISLGVSEFKVGDSISTLFKKADKALYRAKNKGKNQTELIT